MASSQHRMEENANRSRKEVETFKEGDIVWLNLKNIETPQLSKKLSWINAKYEVFKVVDSHSIELNTQSGIWPRFHVDLLKRAAADPLPSQIIVYAQPLPIVPKTSDIGRQNTNKEPEQESFVDRILRTEKEELVKVITAYFL